VLYDGVFHGAVGRVWLVGGTAGVGVRAASAGVPDYEARIGGLCSGSLYALKMVYGTWLDVSGGFVGWVWNRGGGDVPSPGTLIVPVC